MVAVPVHYICGNCEAKISSDDVLCEDWRDKNKSMVCPKCKHYLSLPHNPRKKFAYLAFGISLVVGILMEIYSTQSRVLIFPFLLIAAPAYLWASPELFKPIVTKAHGKSKL